MSTFYYTARYGLKVTRYIVSYDNNCGATYSAALNASEADIVAVNPYGFVTVGQYYRYSTDPSPFYIVQRGLCFYDLSTLSPSEDVNTARIHTTGVWVDNSAGIYAQIFDGTGLTGAKSDYYDIGLLTEVLGSVYIPNVGLDGYYPVLIEFNAAGRTFLESKAGGTAKIAFKVSTEGIAPGNCPVTPAGNETFSLATSTYHKLLINEPLPEVVEGYIWVEGTNFAYLDQGRQKRLKEGTLTAQTGIAGHIWVEGTNFHYIDSAGNERQIVGVQEGATGKTPAQIWIEVYKFKYIDANGDERYIEGTAS